VLPGSEHDENLNKALDKLVEAVDETGVDNAVKAVKKVVDDMAGALTHAIIVYECKDEQGNIHTYKYECSGDEDIDFIPQIANSPTTKDTASFNRARTIQRHCRPGGCCEGKGTGAVTPPPAGQQPPPPGAGTAPQPTPPVDLCDLKPPCPECMDLYNSKLKDIQKDCDRIKAIDSEITKLAAEWLKTHKEVPVEEQGKSNSDDEIDFLGKVRDLKRERENLKGQLDDILKELQDCEKEKCPKNKQLSLYVPLPNPPTGTASTPVGNASTIDQGAYQTVSFNTDQGQINVNLPKEQSDTLSGTVTAVPENGTNSDTLNGMVVDVESDGNSVHAATVSEGVFTAAGAGGILALVLHDSSGNEVARQTVERTPVTTPPSEFTMPNISRPGKTIPITGPTTGRFEDEQLLVGQKPATFVTESTAGSVWRVPADLPAGPTTLELQEAGQTHTSQINVVQLRLNAPTTTLPQGGHTTVTATVEGFQGMDLKQHPVFVRMTIRDPSVVQFTGKGAGGVLTEQVTPDKVKKGVFVIHAPLHALKTGGYEIVCTVSEEKP